MKSSLLVAPRVQSSNAAWCAANNTHDTPDCQSYVAITPNRTLGRVGPRYPTPPRSHDFRYMITCVQGAARPGSLGSHLVGGSVARRASYSGRAKEGDVLGSVVRVSRSLSARRVSARKQTLCVTASSMAGCAGRGGALGRTARVSWPGLVRMISAPRSAARARMCARTRSLCPSRSRVCAPAVGRPSPGACAAAGRRARACDSARARPLMEPCWLVRLTVGGSRWLCAPLAACAQTRAATRLWAAASLSCRSAWDSRWRRLGGSGGAGAVRPARARAPRVESRAGARTHRR